MESKSKNIWSKNILYLIFIILVISNHKTICMKRCKKENNLNETQIINNVVNNNIENNNIINKNNNKEEKVTLPPIFEKYKTYFNSYLSNYKPNTIGIHGKKKPIFKKDKHTLSNSEKYIIPKIVLSNCEFKSNKTPENSPETPTEKENLTTEPKEKQEVLSIEENKKETHELTRKKTIANLLRKKSSTQLLKNKINSDLKNINLDFKIIKNKKNQTKNKQILNINGTVFFCDVRGFTCFSHECPKVEDPAKFMLDITDLGENIVTDWGGYIIGISGDAHLGFFPKSKGEESLKESVLNCFLCSIEFIIKSLDLMKEKKEEYFPKQCDLGLEAGTICFYRLTKPNKVIKFAVTSDKVNLSQRLEDNAKNSTELNTRKITLTENRYNMLGALKKIQKIFGPKYLLQAKGIKGRPFVYSCSLEKIIEFYNSKDWPIFKEQVLARIKQNKPIENLDNLFDLFKQKLNIKLVK